MTEEFDAILKEAYASIEDQLKLEDAGWIKLGATTGGNVLTDAQRKDSILRARVYAVKDPMGRQAIRLWTDYAFGTGMTWAAEDEKVNEVLSGFWQAPENQSVFSCQGQRKSSDKLLIDGEIFFALFLGPQKATLRRIDPLEVTEIITDPDDLEDVRYYKREWSTTSGQQKKGYYRSAGNLKDVGTQDNIGGLVRATEDALVFHLAMNTIGQRGNSMLLPVIDWIKLYRQFLASRVAIMLALARFAWKVKVQGGAATVAAAKGMYNEKLPDAGSVAVENASADLQPIRTDSGAQNAYQDGRQIKLQIAAGTGWPEQYFGDISIGNLATARTVELPVSKMCQSYQAIWADTYNTIDRVVLAQNGVPEDKWYVDRDFPPITPADESEMAKNISAIGMIMPELLSNRDVMQMALMSIGIHDTNEVLDDILKSPQESAAVALSKALRQFREVLKGDRE
uniref:Putative portal protein n=1 Tax=viral metagenome TaxID=1070528 RepID=A0A6M3LXD3_9ZZZZ